MRAFLIGILLLPFALSGQVTIQSSDLPSPGYTGWQSFTVDPTILPVPTGPNLTWDYSSLVATNQEADSFISKFQAPFSFWLQFPFSANLVRVQRTPDSLGGIQLSEAYEFQETASNAYINHGLAGLVNGIPLALRNDPEDRYFPLPLQFGDTDSVASQAELDVQGLAYVLRKQVRKTDVEGWGTITTPFGSFDALLIRSEITGRDSIRFDTVSFALDRPLQIEYRWQSPALPVPVMLILATFDTVLQQEAVQAISYTDSARNLPFLSINEPISRPLGLYPNPANDRVQLDWAEEPFESYSLKVMDLQGRVVVAEDNVQSGQELDVTKLEAGQYLVLISSAKSLWLNRLVVSPD